MKNKDLRIKDLKNIINDLPDDMIVVIPVVDEDDVNHIYGFRKVRTAGILVCEWEDEQKALCLNGSAKSCDISVQIHGSGKDCEIVVERVLYAMPAKEVEDETHT